MTDEKIHIHYDCKNMSHTCMEGRMVRLECATCKRYVCKAEWAMPDYDQIRGDLKAEIAVLTAERDLLLTEVKKKVVPMTDCLAESQNLKVNSVVTAKSMVVPLRKKSVALDVPRKRK